MMGYSIKTGLLEHRLCDAETASETPLWRKLVPTFTPGVFYLFDLGFFERALFTSARAAGAHVLMRLKSTAKVRVLSHACTNGRAPLPGWSLGYYLQVVSKKRGTVFDLDVSWGHGKDLITLRLVGFAHKANSIRWYLTTVPRSMLTANQIIQSYRLRWLIELLFRELKQTADLGRSFTAKANAVAALTYGAMLARALVRSVRIQAALANEIIGSGKLPTLEGTSCAARTEWCDRSTSGFLFTASATRSESRTVLSTGRAYAGAETEHITRASQVVVEAPRCRRVLASF